MVTGVLTGVRSESQYLLTPGYLVLARPVFEDKTLELSFPERRILKVLPHSEKVREGSFYKHKGVAGDTPPAFLCSHIEKGSIQYLHGEETE